MPIKTFIQENAYLILLHGCSLVVLWLVKTSTISDCAARLHLTQTRNFQLLNTWNEISTSKSHRINFRSLILRMKKINRVVNLLPTSAV